MNDYINNEFANATSWTKLKLLYKLISTMPALKWTLVVFVVPSLLGTIMGVAGLIGVIGSILP